MQPARGTVHTVGRIAICDNYPQEFHDDLNFQNVNGAFIEMSDEQVRHVALMLRATVEVWPVCADDLAPGECTPENYAHLKQRLAAAADNLAREVRSNQAAELVRADLERRLTETQEEARIWRSANSSMEAENERIAAELADALSRAKSAEDAWSSGSYPVVD